MTFLSRTLLKSTFAVALLSLAPLAAEDAPATTAVEIAPSAAKFSQAEIEKISEAFGHLIGRNLEHAGFKFDIESVVQGIRNAAAGKPAPMSEEEYEKSLTSIQEALFNDMAAKNLKTAEDFLKQKEVESEVVKLEEGKLQYVTTKPGVGAAVKPHSAPLVHYVGKFADGTVFSSSYETGEPVTLSLDHTIQGFTAGLVGMNEGEKRTLYIHPDLGYGKHGHLPPNSLLVFEVELVKADTAIGSDAEFNEQEFLTDSMDAPGDESDAADTRYEVAIPIEIQDAPTIR